jgi:hypothetical protein
MLKLIPLAVCAALLTTTQAIAESRTVILTGKTPEQVRTEIAKAAHDLCVRETTFEPRRLEALYQCQKETFATAMADAEVKLAKIKSAKTLASR